MPSKLGLLDKICENLELGMPLTLAAEAEGVARATIYQWMQSSKDVHGRVTRARAIGAKRLVQIALEGGKGSSAANWHLERRYREDYGPPEKERHDTEVKIIVEGGLPEFPR